VPVELADRLTASRRQGKEAHWLNLRAPKSIPMPDPWPDTARDSWIHFPVEPLAGLRHEVYET
jgi:hypothetical protein